MRLIEYCLFLLLLALECSAECLGDEEETLYEWLRSIDIQAIGIQDRYLFGLWEAFEKEVPQKCPSLHQLVLFLPPDALHPDFVYSIAPREFMYQLPGYQDIMIPGSRYILQKGSIFGPVAGHPLSTTDFSDVDIELDPRSPMLVRGGIVFKKDQNNSTVVSYTHDETICATIPHGSEFGTGDNVPVRHGTSGTKPWHLFDHHEYQFIPELVSQIHMHHVYGSKESLFFDTPATDVFVHRHNQDALEYSVSSSSAANFTLNIMTPDPLRISLSSSHPSGSSVTPSQDRTVRVIVESNTTIHVQEGSPTLWLDTRQTSVQLGLPFQRLVHKIAEYLLKDMDTIFSHDICLGLILDRGYLIGLSLQDEYEERLADFLSENRSDIRSLILEMQPSVKFPEKTLDLVQHIHDTCSKHINPAFLRVKLFSGFFPFGEDEESPESPEVEEAQESSSSSTPPRSNSTPATPSYRNSTSESTKSNSTASSAGSNSTVSSAGRNATDTTSTPPDPNSTPSETSQTNTTVTTDPNDTSTISPSNDVDSNSSSLPATQNIKEETESSAQCLSCCAHYLFTAMLPWIAIQFT